MTNTIFGFSQPKLIELGIDIVEAQLLDWFVKFYFAYDSKNKCEAMPKSYFKDEWGNTIAYGWIKNSYVIEQLPILGITNERVIARRFEHLSEIGILSKKVINSQKGKLCVYHLNGELYNSLIIYDDKKVVEKKSNTTPKTAEVETEKNSDTLQDTQKYLAKNSEVKNTSHVTQKYLAEQNLNENILQVTQKYLAENNEVKNTYHVTQKYLAEQNLNENNSQVTQKYLAEVTQKYTPEVTQKYLALNNKAINDSLVIDIKYAAAITNILNKYFGENTFDENFPKQAAAFLFSQKIDYEKYITWLFEFVKNKKPKSLRNMFYKLFFKPDVLKEFLLQMLDKQKVEEEELLRKLEEEKRKIKCPICGEIFIPGYENQCPHCKADVLKFDNENYVKKQIKISKMTTEVRNNYENELNTKIMELHKSYNFSEKYFEALNIFQENLDKKYELA